MIQRTRVLSRAPPLCAGGVINRCDRSSPSLLKSIATRVLPLTAREPLHTLPQLEQMFVFVESNPDSGRRQAMTGPESSAPSGSLTQSSRTLVRWECRCQQPPTLLATYDVHGRIHIKARDRYWHVDGMVQTVCPRCGSEHTLDLGTARRQDGKTARRRDGETARRPDGKSSGREVEESREKRPDT